MSRLIDADELKERFCEENCGKNRCVDHMDKCAWILSAEESKTAFDVDEVVERLEEYLFEKYCIEGDTTIDEIVKGGGVE